MVVFEIIVALIAGGFIGWMSDEIIRRNNPTTAAKVNGTLDGLLPTLTVTHEVTYTPTSTKTVS